MSESNAFARVVHVLPHGETAESYAQRCTRAIQSFLYGAPYWDKRDLGAWLIDEYRPVALELEGERTASAPTDGWERSRVGVGPLTASSRGLSALTGRGRSPATVGEESVRELLDRTCTELADVLAEPELLSEQARMHRDVVAGIDAWGEPLLLVVARPRMRLSRRVAALAAASGSFVEVPRTSGAFLTRRAEALSATAYRWTAGGR